MKNCEALCAAHSFLVMAIKLHKTESERAADVLEDDLEGSLDFHFGGVQLQVFPTRPERERERESK